MPSIREASGASLIEALVTIVLLSTSLLGLAMMQAQALSILDTSYTRTQSNVMVSGIIDKMRLNSVSAAEYTAGDPGGDCSEMTVTVENDLNCWYRNLDKTLYRANGAITQDGGQFTVSVNWFDHTDRAESSDLRRVSFTFEL